MPACIGVLWPSDGAAVGWCVTLQTRLEYHWVEPRICREVGVLRPRFAGVLQTRLEYHWVEARICREDLPGAETLPPSGSEKPCPPCSPGMQHGDSLSECNITG